MATNWRSLTPEQAKQWPKARLGGALAAMCAATGLMTLALAVLLVIAAFNLHMLDAFRIPEDLSTPTDKATVLGLIGMLEVALLLAAGAPFFVMTLLRARATPVVSVAALILLFFVVAGLDVGRQMVLMWSIGPVWGIALQTLWTQFAGWLGSAAMIAATSGYLLGGVRPNAYFRRRVAEPPAP